MRLLILRHGETAWTISGQHTGITEIPLTTKGREDVARQGPVIDRLLVGETPLILVSPRQRTVETASLALPDMEYRIEPAIEEFDYGTYEGLTHEQITQENPTWDIWTQGCPGGESPAQIADRVDGVMSTIRSESRPVIVVTHGHTSRMIAVRALGLEPSMGAMFDSASGSLSVISTVRGRNLLGLWNSTAG